MVKAGLDKIAHPVKFAVIDDEADRVALTGDVYADTVGMAVEPRALVPVRQATERV